MEHRANLCGNTMWLILFAGTIEKWCFLPRNGFERKYVLSTLGLFVDYPRMVFCVDSISNEVMKRPRLGTPH
jgi:hypothetical protein